MEANIISIVAIFVVLLLTLWNQRSGGTAYLITVLFAPNVAFGETFFRVEHILTPLMLGIVALKSRPAGRPLDIPSVARVYLAWLIILTISTFIAWPDFHFMPFDSRPVYGFARPLLVLMIFYYIGAGTEWLRLAAILLSASAIPIALLAVAQTVGSGPARIITEHAYTSASRDVFLRLLGDEQAGYLLRSVGVFENVSYAATFFLLSLYCSILILTHPDAKVGIHGRLLAGLGSLASCVGGVFTASATFLGGVIALSVITIATSRQAMRWKAALFGGTLAIVGLGVASLGGAFTFQVMDVLDYQLERMRTGHFIYGRFYSSGGEGLLEAWDLIFQSPILGWGFFSPTGVIVNDSIFAVLLYSGGVIGCLLFLTLPAWLIGVISSKGFAGAMLLGCTLYMLVAGFGSSSHFNIRICDWWWAVLGTSAAIQRAHRTTVYNKAALRPIEVRGCPTLACH